MYTILTYAVSDVMAEFDIALPKRVSIEIEDGKKVMVVQPRQQFSISTIPLETDRISCSRYTILVDWLMNVCMSFKVDPSTFFLSIELLRRFYSVNKIDTNTFQLFGMTCMLIASKFNDVYDIPLDDFAYISARAYTHQQIVDAEMRILDTLNWKIRSAEDTSLFPLFDMLVSVEGSRFSVCQIKYMMYTYILGSPEGGFCQFREKLDEFTETISSIIASESVDNGKYSDNIIARSIYNCVVCDFHRHGVIRISGVSTEDVKTCQEMLRDLIISQ